MKATKQKSGKWRVQLYLGKDPNGKKIIKSFTAPTKRAAMDAAMEYQLSHRKPSEDTMASAIEAYINVRTPVLSPATIRGYKNVQRVLKRDYPQFLDTKLDAVTEGVLQELINSLSVTHTAKSVKNYHGLIVAAMKYKKAVVPSVVLPKRQRTDFNIPDSETARRIFQEARGTELEAVIYLAAAGLRRGEICALTLDDFSDTAVHVHRCKVYSSDGVWVTKAPKTYTSDRYVELPPEIIRRIKMRGYITHMDPHGLTRAHARFLEKHGFTHFRLHDWRHYMVSSLHAEGCSDAFIMAAGGWNSDYVMKQVYRHTLADRDREMSQKAVSHLAGLL